MICLPRGRPPPTRVTVALNVIPVSYMATPKQSRALSDSIQATNNSIESTESIAKTRHRLTAMKPILLPIEAVVFLLQSLMWSLGLMNTILVA